MARLTRRETPDDDDEDETLSRFTASTRETSRRRPQNVGSLSPSPAASFSSDKENHGQISKQTRSSNGETKAMLPPKLPTPPSGEGSAHSNKRRKLGERNAPNASQIAFQESLKSIENTDLYDPEQPMEERRAVRRGIRDLGRDLNGKLSYEYPLANHSGSWYINRESSRILDSPIHRSRGHCHQSQRSFPLC